MHIRPEDSNREPKYWAVAVGIDADGHDDEAYRRSFYSADCAESTNTFEIATTAIRTDRASITVTPSNSDVYFLDVLSADIQSQVPTGTDYQKYLIDRYFGWGMLDMYLHEGPFTYEAKNSTRAGNIKLRFSDANRDSRPHRSKPKHSRLLKEGSPNVRRSIRMHFKFGCRLQVLHRSVSRRCRLHIRSYLGRGLSGLRRKYRGGL